MEERVEKIEVLILDKEGIDGRVRHLKLIDDNIYICSQTEDAILMYVKKENKYECILKIPKEFNIKDKTFRIGSTGGFFQIKRSYYIIDSQSKMIYRILPRSRSASPIFSFSSLKKNQSSSIISSGASKITDLIYQNGQLWFTIKAGYSSSVNMYDFKTNSIYFKSFSKGPSPNGIVMDTTGKYYWILDSYNRQLYKFNTEGKGLYAFPIEGYEDYSLTGLLMDKDGGFITVGIKDT